MDKKQMKSKQYVMVTAISQHRMRYCIPVEDLETTDPEKAKEWAKDSVTMEEVQEFSQYHIGESILDATIIDEHSVLKMFDEDSPFLLDKWTKEQKLNWINDWRNEDESG